MGKYRAGISRSSKRKKPPGKLGQKVLSASQKEAEAVNNSNSSTPDPVDFSTNINIDHQDTSTNIDQDTSTFSKKLKLDEDYIRENKSSACTDNLEWCYLLVDTRILIDIVDTIGSCPSCSEKINCYHNVNIKQGLAHSIELNCTKCDWVTSFTTSKQVERNIHIGEATKSPGSGKKPLM